MTEPLYMDDSSVRTFEATVERVIDDSDDGGDAGGDAGAGDGEDGAGGRVVLDRTHFYPQGGGQPADHGTLAYGDDGDDGGVSVAVTDVEKTDTVYHRVDGPLPDPGVQVSGTLDWERRHAHMRYHTAQHLLSAVLLDEYDAPTVGNQLYADRARIDVEHDRFTDTDLADVEALLNDAIDRAMTVDWYTMERERAERELDTDRTRIDLLPDSITELRIVEIRDDGDVFDRTACAGTHVRSTADLGRLRVTGRQTGGSGRERLSFVLE